MRNRNRTIAAGLAIVFLLSIAETTISRKSSTGHENDNKAQQALLKSGDTYFDVSQYREALTRYQDAVTLAAKKADWLAEAMALTRLTRVEIYLGDNDLAQKHITRARDLLTRDQRNLTPEAKNAYGEALTSQGELDHARGNFKRALNHFDEALTYLDGDPNGQARAHLFIGYIAGSIGNLEKASTEISEARSLSQTTNNKAGEGQALSALGLIHSQRGDQDGAIELHKSALEIFRTIGDRHSEAIANNALGQAYELLEQYQLALSHYQQALHLFDEAGAVNGIAPTNCFVGDMYFRSKDPDRALKSYERCLNLSRSAGMVRTEIRALTEIATLYISQQRFELALAQHKKIQKFFERIGDRRGLETAFSLYGDLLFQTGQKKNAADAYTQALSLSKEIGDKGGEIPTLYNLARTSLALDAPEDALSYIQRSLKLIEDLRARVDSPEFRTSYFSGVQQHYELCIQILMQLERLHPEKDFGAQALLVSERSRARLLQDLVTESGANIRQGASKDLLDRERELRALIRAQAEYQLDLASKPKDPAERAEVENELQQLKAEYQRVEAQVRVQNPYLMSLEQFGPANLEQIQKTLQENDTVLEFSLGEERSYLWVITRTVLQTYELPKKEVLEDLSRDLYEALTMPQRIDGSGDYVAQLDAANKDVKEKGAALSQLLLGPIASQLVNRRLVIVPDGALQYIPFQALPAPLEKNSFLLETNEVVLEPSLSALIAIRNNKSQHANAPDKLVAVIADPVLDRTDDRVQSQPLSPASALASTDKPLNSETATRDARLTRLAHASEEADAISGVAPWSTTLVAKGFDASRETAMSANVGQYQIVHFATHGIVDTEHPELSGIVLTRVDRNGAKTDGLMPLHDIYSMDLSAELTVLSACQTALGKDIRGEGLVGLSHAFMSAGSKSVVSSLWKVDDRATAVLMREFYESMLQQGLSPAAALRSAQLKMMREKGTSAPYYWAGFVIQGEYTNHIVIDHRPSFRVALVLLSLLILVTAGVLVLQRRKRRVSLAQLS